MADLRVTDEDEENKSTRQRQYPPVRDEMRDQKQQEMHDQKGVTEEMHDQEHQETHRSGALVKRWLRGRRLRFRRMWKRADCSCAFRSLVTVSHELTHTHQSVHVAGTASRARGKNDPHRKNRHGGREEGGKLNFDGIFLLDKKR